MYSTDLIIKLYAFMNLLFMLLLLTHDYTYYLFFFFAETCGIIFWYDKHKMYD